MNIYIYNSDVVIVTSKKPQFDKHDGYDWCCCDDPCDCSEDCEICSCRPSGSTAQTDTDSY